MRHIQLISGFTTQRDKGLSHSKEGAGVQPNSQLISLEGILILFPRTGSRQLHESPCQLKPLCRARTATASYEKVAKRCSQLSTE